MKILENPKSAKKTEFLEKTSDWTKYVKLKILKLIIQEWIESNPNLTLKEIVLKFSKQIGLKIGKSSIHRALSTLGFAHITGRKMHYKTNPKKQEDLKKTQKKVAREKKPIFFFDESRFGTHSKSKLAWLRKGHRKSMPYKLGFESFYVYTEASTFGDNLSLFIDGVDLLSALLKIPTTAIFILTD
jgi:arginine repressor